MSKLSVETFLEYLRKSELTNETQLEAALEKIRTAANQDNANDADWVASELVKEGLITNWHVRQLMKRKYKGFYLRQYRILGHLGTGGMSTVYLAEHTLMQRRVAIKVLPKKRLSNSIYLDRFVREAQAIASLDHPHIVRAYDIDRFEDIHYIVMEYFDGHNLRQLVEKEGPLPYEDAVNYIRQGAEGLVHAHRLGIIHRDVKPENLLANDKGVVKLLDLGLALLDESSFNQPQSSINEDKILGTADYLAPEQAIDSHNVDARADIYSLGCTLYFCLTGHAPFPFGTIPQRLMAHQKEIPTSIFSDRPDAPNDLVEICEKMMAKKAADRYQSAGEVVQTLTRWLIQHGFAEPQDFPAGSGGLDGQGAEHPEDEFFSRELSYLKSASSATILGDMERQTLTGDSGIFSSGVGNEVVVNLLGSGAGSQPGGSAGGNSRTDRSASPQEPKEILLSKNVRMAPTNVGFDPLALAMDEIKTGRHERSGSGAGRKRADAVSAQTADGGSIHEGGNRDDSTRYAKQPAADGTSRLDGASAPRERSDTAKYRTAEIDAHRPTVISQVERKPGAGETLSGWYRKVPFWFWAVFLAGYVLATFLAGILFALLMNLNQ